MGAEVQGFKMSIIKGIFGKDNVLKHVTLDGVRIHLKTDERKLWINGYYTLFLNKTANNILENFIDSCYEVEKEQVVERTLNKLKRKYWFVKRGTLEKDLQNLVGIINSFARNEIPANLVGVKLLKESTAPTRMDVSLTYRCNNKCPHCYLSKNADQNGDLSKEQWKIIIDKLWKIGIPQIVFSGGECTLREDLPEIVEYSKKFITGIISNGTNITPKLAKELKKVELDWIQVTLDSSNPETHDEMQGRKGAFTETIEGIKNAVKEGLAVSVNMTITMKNKDDVICLIDLAKKLGVSSVSTNALINSGRGADKKKEDGVSEKELKEILQGAKLHAGAEGIEFNWFLPTCYKNLNPIELGFGQRCCSACSVNMMIEPNGDVIPCQSWTQIKLGNILKDSWESIWNNENSKKIRAFGFASDDCKKCEHFKLCGGMCPLDKINYRRCGQ